MIGMRRIVVILLLVTAQVPVAAAQEAPETHIRLGISMERSSSAFREQIAAMRGFFQAMGIDWISLHPLPPDELMQAIRNRQLDAALLNPYQTARAQHIDQRTRPLVAFQAKVPGGRVGGVGGVMLARAEATEIRELADLRGRRVGIASRDSFGGYAAPLYELHLLDPQLPGSLQITETGSHRNAIASLLAGEVDVAFIETVILEQLIAEEAVGADALRVINPQNLSSYPVATSTQLYPGWALVGLPSLTGSQTDALLQILLDVRRRQITGLYGDFSLAPNYAPVHRILTELGLPPYHRTSGISWLDIWRNEPLTMLLWVSITIAALLFAGFLMVYTRRIRGLFQQEKLNARRERALRDMPTDIDPVDIRAFVRTQLGVIRQLTGSHFAGIYTIDRENQQIEAYALDAETRNGSAPASLQSEALLAGGGWAESSHGAQSLILNDYHRTGRRQVLPGADMAMERLLLSPVEPGSGDIIMGVGNKRTAYSAQDLKTVELLSAQLWRTVRRSEAEALLEAKDREARASAELLQGIFDSFAGGIIVYGGAGGIQLMNPMASEFFGVSARDVIGRELRDFGWTFCDRDGTPVSGDSDPVSQVLEQRSAVSNLTLGVSREGTRATAWVLMNIRPLLDSAGSISRIVVSFADVSSMKNAENELMLAAEVFETAAEGIIIADAEWRIINVNRAFSEITGYTLDEVQGRTPAILRSSAHDQDFYERMLDELRIAGKWRGERTSRRKDGAHFHEMLSVNAITDGRGEVARYIAVFSDISLLKHQQAELEHQAYYDALTGVPNRALGVESLKLAMQQCQRRGRLVAVAYIDLDNFKEVNDTHGHDVGDKLLKMLAARMHVALREGDTLARIGGDEFVAILSDLHRETDCLPIVERLLALSTEPVTIDGQVLSPTASIGISFYPMGENELDAEQLLRQADHAMYQAKTEGRNCFRLFDQASNQLLEDKHQLVNEVRRGIAANEFRLHYQPKVDLNTGRIHGAEALIRWQHPDRGFLPPNRFLIPLENHSVLIELGDWVIDQALRDLSLLAESGTDLSVSVNISPPQLLVEGFAESIRHRLLAHPKLEGRQLELEILETSALENTRDVAEVISACAEFGVHFALDDFGSGYSSLVYLQALPIDTLKIDQTFVRNMTSESADIAILRAIVSLARALDIKIVAEGAETEEHCRLLRALGCEVAQGYAFARPMPLEELVSWLKDWQPSRAFPADAASGRDAAMGAG